jgi:hypothetical protein
MNHRTVRTLPANKAADGLGARSVQLIHSTLRTMLSEAMREELIERNVVTVVQPPSVERVGFNRGRLRRRAGFLTASADHRLYALFAVGVALGLRKGGCSLSVDVDLEGGVLHVRQRAAAAEMGLVFGPLTSNRSCRTIPHPAASARSPTSFVVSRSSTNGRAKSLTSSGHHDLINPDTGWAAFTFRDQRVLDLETGAVVYRVRASRALDLTSIVVSEDPNPLTGEASEGVAAGVRGLAKTQRVLRGRRRMLLRCCHCCCHVGRARLLPCQPRFGSRNPR